MIGAVLYDRLVGARLDIQGHWSRARQCLPVQAGHPMVLSQLPCWSPEGRYRSLRLVALGRYLSPSWLPSGV